MSDNADRDKSEQPVDLLAALQRSIDSAKVDRQLRAAPDEPTVIIPTGHCWLAHAHRDHPPHLYGNPPNTRRCPGQATKDEPMSIQPDMDALNAARVLDGIKRWARAGRLVYKLEAQGDQPVKPSDIIRTAEKEPQS